MTSVISPDKGGSGSDAPLYRVDSQPCSFVRKIYARGSCVLQKFWMRSCCGDSQLKLTLPVVYRHVSQLVKFLQNTPSSAKAKVEFVPQRQL